MMVAICEWSLGQVSLYCELSEKVVSMVTHTHTFLYFPNSITNYNLVCVVCYHSSGDIVHFYTQKQVRGGLL